MRIANGVEMLEISSSVLGMKKTVYPVLLWDDNDTVLVDTGYPGQLELFREAVEKAGVPFKSINRVIITHQDMDHIGSLSSIIKYLGGKVQVISHQVEKQYITGEKTPVKIAQLEARRDSLSEDMKAFHDRLKANYENFKTDVDRTVVDGELLPYCGGIRVIHTPGHTPGHISLYHIKSRTLVAGDALNIDNGCLAGPNPKYTYDMEEGLESVKRFAGYDIENIVCYHGGLYNEDANKSIIQLIGQFNL